MFFTFRMTPVYYATITWWQISIHGYEIMYDANFGELRNLHKSVLVATTLRLANPVTEILLQPGGSEATRLAPSKPGGRRSVHVKDLSRRKCPVFQKTKLRILTIIWIIIEIWTLNFMFLTRKLAGSVKYIVFGALLYNGEMKKNYVPKGGRFCWVCEHKD